MKNCLTSLTFIITSVGYTANCQETLWEKSSPHIVDRAVVIASGDFNVPHLRELAKQYFHELAGTYALARVIIGTTPEDVTRASRQLRLSTTYADEVQILKQRSLIEGPVGRVLIWNGAGTLSIRDHENLITESISSGPSTIELRDENESFELLHFVLSINAAPVTPKDKYVLRMFFKSDLPLSINASIAITKRIQSLTNVGTLIVDVQPDTWFFEDTAFPNIYLFAKDLELPSEFHLEQTPRLSCGYRWRKGVTCTGQGFVP